MGERITDTIHTGYKQLDIVTASFAVTSVASGVIAGKLIDVGGHIIPASVILFPLTYIFGDILTEVYGFLKARRVIWIGFGCSATCSILFGVTAALPSPVWFDKASAYAVVLGQVPLIAVAGWLAFLLGEYSNSVVMSLLKKATKGKKLWLRAVASTVVGELVDTAIFLSLAFGANLEHGQLVIMILTLYVCKVLVEVLFLPFTYYLCNLLKRLEGIDVYDYGVKYSLIPGVRVEQ